MYGNAIDGLNAKQLALALSTQHLTKAQMEEIIVQNDLISKYGATVLIKQGLLSANSSLLASEQAVGAEGLKRKILNASLNEEKAAEFIQTQLIISANGEEAASTVLLNKELMNEAVKRGILSSENAAEILSSYGVVAADTAETASKNALTAATWAQVKSQLALMASNPVTWIVATAAAIYGCVKAYNALTLSTEEIREAAEEAKSAIEEIESEFESLNSTTNNTKTRFAELAQGVENLGKANQSRGKLTTEDYEEFLSLSNQLAELFPQLKIGFDDNGNAILNLSGNVDTIVGSLENLVSVQQKLTNQEILENMPDVWTGYTVDLAEYNNSLGEAKANVLDYQKALSEITSGKVTISDPNVDAAIISALEKMYIDPYSYISESGQYLHSANARPGDFASGEWDFSLLDEGQLYQLKNNLVILGNEYESAVLTAKGKIETANSEMADYINTWLSGEWNFSKMNSDMQNVVKDVLLNSDWISQLPDDIDSSNWSEVSNWLQQEFLYAVGQIDDTKIQNALVDAFNGEFTVESLQGVINQLLNTQGFDANNPLVVYLQTKIDDTKQFNFRKKKSLTDIYDKDSNHTVSSSEEKAEYDKLIEYTKDFSDAQWEAWIAATAGAESAEEAIQKYKDSLTSSEIYLSDIFALKDINDNATALSELNDELSELESAYNTCLAAKEEFDEQGYLSVDTLQKVLSLGDEYLQYLFDEEGNLCLDTEAFQALTLARINDMEAQALETLAGNIKQITDEAAATEYLAQKKNELAASYKDAAISALAEMSALEGFSDSEAMQNAYNSFMAQYNRIKNLFANARAGVYETYSSRSKSDFGAKRAETDWKNMLDNEITLLEKQLESALITYQEYVRKRREVIEEYYRAGKISAKEYYDYVEKMLETQKSIYDKVLSAVTKRFDREIDRIQESIDAIEKQNEALEKQKDEYDSILSVVDSVYEKQIEHIQSQQDAIQDTIDALQEENDEHKFALQLEQAKWELYRAQTQRTKKVFNGTEFVYGTDRDAIRDAQENLADLTLEQTVDGLEKEKDALNAVIEELEYYRDIWNEISGAKEKAENEQLAIALWGKDYEKLILSNRLSDIESFKDNYLSTQQQINDNQTLIDSYNEKVEYYEALKESWNSVTDAYETAMNEQLAAQVLGADWESQILSGRLETLQHFRDEYIAIQQAITAAALESANSQAAAENAANTSNTSTGNPGNPAYEERLPGNDRVVHIAENATWYDPVTKKSGTGTPPERLRNVMMAYGRGTDNAREGYHLIAETGTEIIRDNYGNAVIAEGKQLHHFDGGETVFSPSETRELLSGELTPLDSAFAETSPTLRRQSDVLLEQWQKIVPNFQPPISPINSMSRLPQYFDLPVSRENSITVSIGDIHLHEVQKVNTLARDIVLELPKKVTQELGKRRT